MRKWSSNCVVMKPFTKVLNNLTKKGCCRRKILFCWPMTVSLHLEHCVFVHLDHFRALRLPEFLCCSARSYVAVRALRRFANNKIWRSHAEITSAHVVDHPWSVKKDIALVALLFKALEKSMLHLQLNISSWTIAYLVARISDQCGLRSKYQGGEAWIKQLPCNTML